MYVEVYGTRVTVELKGPRFMKNDEGRYEPSKDVIYLKENLPLHVRRQVASHETFHAFLEKSGMSQMLLEIGEHAEEALTRAFEHGMGNLIVFPEQIEAWIKGADQKNGS